MKQAVLEGLRVLELARYLPGPLATLMLADLGAEVIKIEDPGGGDPLRALPPLYGGIGYSFHLLNRNKRSLALNLKSAGGREVLLKLAADCDVLLEGFRPGVMERLGLGWETLSRQNPRLIFCSISGYGQAGPLSGRAGHDINFCARAGVLGLCSSHDGFPQVPGVQLADVCGGAWHALAGVLGALLWREQTGQGQRLDISMTDGVLSTCFLAMQEVLAGGAAWPRGKAPLGGWGLPGYGVFRCADGKYLAAGALEAQFFANLCRALELPHLQDKGALLGPEADAVRAELAAAFAKKSRAEWLEIFKRVDACVEPVWEGEEVLADEQLRARGMFAKMPAEGSESHRLLETPLRLAGVRPQIRPAPTLGEHTREILAQMGYPAGRIDEFFTEGIVGG